MIEYIKNAKANFKIGTYLQDVVQVT